MKHILSILFIFASISILIARGGGGGHSSGGSHSSSHSSGGHSSSGHTTTHHISEGTHTTTTKSVRSYTRVTHIEPTEIHSYSTGSSNYLYYYLLFNHNTNTNDTIQSNTQEDLTAQVNEISDVDDSEMSDGAVIIVIAISIVLIFGLVYFLSR